MKKYLLLFFISFSSLEAAPVRFTFLQDGFDEGARVTGSFTGDDMNNDRRIGESEIINFSMEFSGNSIVPAFSLEFSDTRPENSLGFAYDLDGGPLGDASGEGIEIISNDFFYQDIPGPGTFCDVRCGTVIETDFFDNKSNSFQLVQVSAVPVPISIWLFGSGLFGLFGMRKSINTIQSMV